MFTVAVDAVVGRLFLVQRAFAGDGGVGGDGPWDTSFCFECPEL